LRLLLLLSALIAGVTGLIAGAPAAARGEPAAIAAALRGGAEVQSELVAVRHLPASSPRFVRTNAEHGTATYIMAAQRHQVDERRLE